jgi:N-acetylglutamate synthase-like GNAT family acetyltransferase/DNA-binding MarR family transcriptional regulator
LCNYLHSFKSIKMDVIKQLGEVALGSRLKRLSDRWAKEAKGFYELNGLDFEPRWFPLFYTLSQEKGPPKGRLSIGELSERVGQSHPAIIQFVKELEQNGWIVSEKCGRDARRRLISLSPKAQDLMPNFRLVWQIVSEEILKIIKQQKNNILFAIEELEEILDRENYAQNLANNLKIKQLNMIEILDYTPQYQQYFVDINIEWIEKYFKVEPMDEAMLNQAQENILDKGGRIYFARFEGEIVGTVALKKMSDDEFELSKMGVRPQAQGKQIGKKLVLHAIEEARKMGVKQLFLETNSILAPAIELYKKCGFHKVSLGPSPYERSDVQMIMVL